MAFSGENANLTWQRVNIAAMGLSPSVQKTLKALKQTLSQDYKNPTLQFVPFDKTTNGSDGSNADTVICAGACRLVALVAKKGSTATAAYLKGSNHATAVQAQGEVILAATEASEELCFVSPKGKSLSTGLVLAGVTAYNGTTHNVAAASFDGFAIIRAS